MKTLLLTATIFVGGFHGFAKGVENTVMSPKTAVPAGTTVSKPPMTAGTMGADTVVWAGLDYALVRMIGGENFEYGFNVPDTIFPGTLEKWNQLFLDERAEVIAHTLRRRVLVDISGVTERNKTATAKQIILTPGSEDEIRKSHIRPQDIAAEVQSYKMANTNGLGLVFVPDRLVRRSHAPAPNNQVKSTNPAVVGHGRRFMLSFLILPLGRLFPPSARFMVFPAAAISAIFGLAQSKTPIKV